MIEPGDVEAALRTAAAIGDDTLQKRSQGYAVPDSFTHGSSEQRQRWFTHRAAASGLRRKAATHSRAASMLTEAMAGNRQSREFVPLKFAVLTVSDTREIADDKSGATLVERIEAAGHTVADAPSCRDDVETIRTRVKKWIADPAVDVIITTGGTGFTGRDVTPEAVEPLFEKRMEAFATLFLMVSPARSAPPPSRRARRRELPGRPTSSACRARRAPAEMRGTRFSCHQLDYRYRPCNFVEIMPRLDEHLRRPKAQGATV